MKIEVTDISWNDRYLVQVAVEERGPMCGSTLFCLVNEDTGEVPFCVWARGNEEERIAENLISEAIRRNALHVRSFADWYREQAWAGGALRGPNVPPAVIERWICQRHSCFGEYFGS